MEDLVKLTRKSRLHNKNEHDHSIPTLMSYNLGEFLGQILGRGIGGIYLFFFETELLLGGGFIIAANIIYSIWNAVNDPVLGYYTGKPTRWTKKWGKFFPWIVISGIPYIISYVALLFAPSSWPQWGIFAWMLLSLCLTDTFSSIHSVSQVGLYPTKFFTERDRRRSGQVNVIIGTLGTVVAFLVPPFLYSFGDIPSYRRLAIYIGIFAIFIWFLMLPGVKPDKQSLKIEQEQETDTSFWRVLKTALKQKNFMIYLIGFLCYSIWVAMITTSIPYYVKHILVAEAGLQTIIWVFYLGGTLISLPLWNWIAKKFGFVKLFGICLIFMGLGTIPLAFFTNLYVVYGTFFILGFFLGGFWAAWLPIFGLVMDEVFYDTKKLSTGVYLGIRTFFSRFEIIFRTLIFIGIHKLTRFNPAVVLQPNLANFGIFLHASYIPSAIALIGAIIFLLLFKISKEKQVLIKEFVQQSRMGI